VSDIASPFLTASDLLDLETVGPRVFRSRFNQRNHGTTIFGGQLVAQSLAAAMLTVRDWPAHSLHGYFLQGGAVDIPVDYAVDQLRDGRSLAARNVTASQAGRTIFQMLCSFHQPETGFEHQTECVPGVPPPESLQSVSEFVTSHAEQLPDDMVRSYQVPFVVELKPVDPEGIFIRRLREPRRQFWMRVPSAAAMDDLRADQCMLAFASDYFLAGVAAGQHRSPATAGGFSIISLDHSIWFHRPASAADWLLCCSDSPSAQAGRGVARGLIYDRAGRLIASAAQEALMRPPIPK
jgi:acyl-CoA thioesterase-2